MKRKILIVVGLFVMFVAGFFVGKYQENQIWSRYADHYLYWWPATSEARRMVRILNYLQNGQQQEAIDALNVHLDYSLFNMNNFTNFPEDFGIKAIQDARAYRSKYPWKNPNPKEGAVVDEILFPKNKK